MLYASNWPHVSKPIDAQPDDRLLLDLMIDWAPDESVRQLIFVDNPARLYGFRALVLLRRRLPSVVPEYAALQGGVALHSGLVLWRSLSRYSVGLYTPPPP